MRQRAWSLTHNSELHSVQAICPHGTGKRSRGAHADCWRKLRHGRLSGRLHHGQGYSRRPRRLREEGDAQWRRDRGTSDGCVEGGRSCAWMVTRGHNSLTPLSEKPSGWRRCPSTRSKASVKHTHDFSPRATWTFPGAIHGSSNCATTARLDAGLGGST